VKCPLFTKRSVVGAGQSFGMYMYENAVVPLTARERFRHTPDTARGWQGLQVSFWQADKDRTGRRRYGPRRRLASARRGDRASWSTSDSPGHPPSERVPCTSDSPLLQTDSTGCVPSLETTERGCTRARTPGDTIRTDERSAAVCTRHVRSAMSTWMSSSASSTRCTWRGSYPGPAPVPSPQGGPPSRACWMPLCALRTRSKSRMGQGLRTCGTTGYSIPPTDTRTRLRTCLLPYNSTWWHGTPGTCARGANPACNTGLAPRPAAVPLCAGTNRD